MGQSLKKIDGGEKKAAIEQCYDKYFENSQDWGMPDFFHAVCLTVEEINKKMGNTQFRVPQRSTLEEAYQKHHRGKGKGKELTKEEFQKILQEVMLDTGVTGFGAKDVIFYMFAAPVTALLFKQRLLPNAIPNEVFVPGVTSATVFILAKLNKI